MKTKGAEELQDIKACRSMHAVQSALAIGMGSRNLHTHGEFNA
jgi:hypothetical protein